MICDVVLLGADLVTVPGDVNVIAGHQEHVGVVQLQFEELAVSLYCGAEEHSVPVVR